MKLLQTIKNIISYTTAPVGRVEPEMKRTFKVRYDDTGIFTYDEEGFTIKLKDGIEGIKWTDIERLVAYKLDLMTTDEICLDIVYGEYKITISEETKVWYQFVERAKILFDIDKDWDSNIAHPAFATNLTILYEKHAELLLNGNNFYACFKGISKEEIKERLENNGWTPRKAGWDEFELTNNWSELIVESHYDVTLLSGAVVCNNTSIAIFDEIFLNAKVPFKYEFYGNGKKLLMQSTANWQ